MDPRAEHSGRISGIGMGDVGDGSELLRPIKDIAGKVVGQAEPCRGRVRSSRLAV